MTPAGTRVVGYVRVSTADQAENGASLEAQRRAIEEAAERRGWVLVSILEDRGVSAKSMKDRKGLEGALGLVEAGGAEALVVAKLDRLSRSLVDFGKLMERARAVGWKIVVLDMDLDMTTATGEVVANVLMAFAQFERRLIGERTKAGMAQKKREGSTFGRQSTIPDRVRRRILRERSAGRSLNAIAEGLNDDAIPTGQGGARWYASTVRAVLERSHADA